MINIKLTKKTPEVKTYTFKDLKPGDKFRGCDGGFEFMKVLPVGRNANCHHQDLNAVCLAEHTLHYICSDNPVIPIDLPKEESPKAIPFKDLPSGSAYKHDGDNNIYIKMKDCSYTSYNTRHMSFGLSQMATMWTTEDSLIIPVDLNVEASH